MLFALHCNERADFSGKSIVNGLETWLPKTKEATPTASPLVGHASA